MMEMSKQFIELARIAAERMLQDGESVAPIGTTGFYLLSSEQEFAGYTPINAIEVDGKRLFIAWEKWSD